MYCLNPDCENPQNSDDAVVCQSCGSQLVALIRGRYRVIKPIGQGGFGKTFLALDEDRLGTRCVLKQFSPRLSGSGASRKAALEKAIQLFNQEAKQLLELGEHPQIPSLYAYFEHDSRLYLVQQFIEGQNLWTELHQQGPLNEEQTRQLLADLLPVLHYIHERQVIHRDLKPGNIIRRKVDNRLVLIDFGLAKQLSPDDIARTGTKLGTEGYAPLEQLRSGKAYPASDLYSLGMTSLNLMTKCIPGELYDPLQGWIWREMLQSQGVSEHLIRILDKMTRDMVGDRYQSAQEVLADLTAPPTVTAPPVRAVPVPPPPPPRSNLGGVASAIQSPGTKIPTATAIRVPPAAPSKAPISAESQIPTTTIPKEAGSKSPTPTPTSGWICINTLRGHSSWVTSVAVSANGQWLGSGALDDTVRIWDLSTGQPIRTLARQLKAVNAIAISPDSQSIAAGSDDDLIKVWNLQTGALRHTLVGHLRDVNAIAISRDGKFLASGSEDRTVMLWNMQNGQLLRTLSGDGGMIKSLAISPDGRCLVSGSMNNTICIWDLSTGKSIYTLSAHFNSINALAISPDGKTLASGSKDQKIKLWDLQKGESTHLLVGHNRDVNALAFSPDGRFLASGSSDETIKLWNPRTGELLYTLDGHTGVVASVAFSPIGIATMDGNGNRLIRNIPTLVSGSWDKTIKIWQLIQD